MNLHNMFVHMYCIACSVQHYLIHCSREVERGEKTCTRTDTSRHQGGTCHYHDNFVVEQAQRLCWKASPTSLLESKPNGFIVQQSQRLFH